MQSNHITPSSYFEKGAPIRKCDVAHAGQDSAMRRAEWTAPRVGSAIQPIQQYSASAAPAHREFLSQRLDINRLNGQDFLFRNICGEIATPRDPLSVLGHTCT